MARLHLTAEDRMAVATAVAAAETGTDGEIVTVLAPQSDAYHDVALHYAVAAVLMTGAVAAIRPELLSLGDGGWGRSMADQLFWLLVAQTIAFLLVRIALAWRPLRLLLTPRATKARRVRRAAVRAFRIGAEERTAAREGVLIYLSVDERMAEIVVDAAVHSAAPHETWGGAMVGLVDAVRAGQPGAGLVAAVDAVGAVLAEHFPKTETDVNEIADRLVEL